MAFTVLSICPTCLCTISMKNKYLPEKFSTAVIELLTNIRKFCDNKNKHTKQQEMHSE